MLPLKVIVPSVLFFGLAAALVGPIASADTITQCPCVRSVQWDDLPTEPQQHARRLGYYRDNWNHRDFDSNSIEDRSFDSLTAEQQDDARALGYATPQSWDCCVNHYYLYWWDDMGDRYPSAQAAYGRLGYTQRAWDLELEVAVDYRTWCRNVTVGEEDVCMTAEEVAAASELCFTGASYRGESLAGVPFTTYDRPGHCTASSTNADQPEEDDVPSNVAGITSSSATSTEEGYQPPVCPCVRYTPWDDLTPQQTTHARHLGYDRSTWNYVNKAHNPLEDLYFVALSPEQQSNATALGYSPENHGHQWTCCVNHYMWHHWGHMGNWHPEAQAAYAVLGWSKQRWNLWRDLPPSVYKVWCRNVTSSNEDVCLSGGELDAMHSVCHTESTHRGDSLTGPPYGTYIRPDYCDPEPPPAYDAPTGVVPAGDDALPSMMEAALQSTPLPTDTIPTAKPTAKPAAKPTAKPNEIVWNTDAPSASQMNEEESQAIDDSKQISHDTDAPSQASVSENEEAPQTIDNDMQSASAGSSSLGTASVLQTVMKRAFVLIVWVLTFK